MKVLMLNGSCNLKGSTFLALEEIGKCLKTYNIDYEIFQIGPKPVRDCIGCGKCAELKKCIFMMTKLIILFKRPMKLTDLFLQAPFITLMPAEDCFHF